MASKELTPPLWQCQQKSKHYKLHTGRIYYRTCDNLVTECLCAEIKLLELEEITVQNKHMFSLNVQKEKVGQSHLLSLWLSSKRASVWFPSTGLLLLAIVWYSFFLGAEAGGGGGGHGAGGGGGGGGDRGHSTDIFPALFFGWTLTEVEAWWVFCASLQTGKLQQLTW